MKPNRSEGISAPVFCAVLSLFLWSAAQGEPTEAPTAAATTATGTATTASQETPATVKTPPGDKSATGPADKPSSAPDAATPNPADADKVALNLRGANIDQVLSFLSELTGMPVMKQKDAKAQITIVNKDKVAKQDAIRMICEALRLDGTAVVMRDHIIWLVPESQVSSLDIGLTSDTGKLPSVGVITRPIPVKFADVTELEKIIRPLLGKNATLIASEATRQLIITDSADRILNVQRVLAQLDALNVDNRQLQIFQLHYADSEELAPILRTVMAPLPRGNSTSGQSGATPSGPVQPGGGPPGSSERNTTVKTVNDVEVQSYKAANSLVVVAPKEKLAKIAQLVAEMDQELTQEVKLRTIPIKYASAQDLARQLGDLVRKRYDKKVREVIEVASDQRLNTIVVLSSEQNFKAIQGIVVQLDTEESLETRTEWYELHHADAEDLAQQMNDLYQGMQQNTYPFFFFFGGNRQPVTRFVCEKRLNSLIAIAPPAEFERIGKLVERLDQVIDSEQAAPRLYPVRHVDAKELADVLNKVFGVQDAKTVTHDYWENVQQVGGTRASRLNGKVRFDPLIGGNAIIVTTSNKENFPIIEGFLRQMDDALPESFEPARHCPEERAGHRRGRSAQHAVRARRNQAPAEDPRHDAGAEPARARARAGLPGSGSAGPVAAGHVPHGAGAEGCSADQRPDRPGPCRGGRPHQRAAHHHPGGEPRCSAPTRRIARRALAQGLRLRPADRSQPHQRFVHRRALHLPAEPLHLPGFRQRRADQPGHQLADRLPQRRPDCQRQPRRALPVHH